MPASDFINELKSLGYKINEFENNKVSIEYVVPVGKNIGIKIFIGFVIPNDFPLNAPHGPHFKSNGILEWVEPLKIHNSSFGPDWKHWSRPFPDWNKSKKTVKIYMSHIRNILANL